MVEEVSNSDIFYGGADYGFDSDINSDYAIDGPGGSGYQFSTGDFAIPTDPRTSNQLQELGLKKLNTGAKTFEISGINAAQLENIPDQHLDEINRLRKLAGVDLTFHGLLLEPTGVTRQGWEESHRTDVEKQMWSSVERAHKMDPDGNINITFHSSNGLPEPMTKVKEEVLNPKTGKMEVKEKIKNFWVVDKHTGHFDSFTPKPNFFKSLDKTWEGDIKSQEEAFKELIKNQNKQTWFKQLQGVAYHASHGNSVIGDVISGEDGKKVMKAYKDYIEGGEIKKIFSEDKGPRKDINEKLMQSITQGDIYLRDAYQDLQNLFNQAYDVAVKNGLSEDVQKLEKYRSEMKSKVEYIEDPSKMDEFGKAILKGVDVLRSIKPPQMLQPLREFGVDKASDTFSNLAFKGYEKFGNTAPIISIENPPAGAAFSRAEDLRDIVNASRKKLINNLMKKKKLSRGAAEKQAEKLIGVTWDVGHINMIRKHGYTEKDLIKETKTVAPMVNKIHLSDNFGLEHTELPMGMGNVPTKPMLEAIEKYNKKIKKVIEVGTWFGPQAFGNAQPFKEVLRAFGSPIYSMGMAPQWNNMAGVAAGYSAGYGQMLPETHFSVYGAGFSNIPVDLGGQMGGQSRVSGAPIG